jgi:PAS domain S-box-containing protein
MTESFTPEQQLKAFINAAQYLVGLTAGQDIWEEAGKVLVKFFGADFAAFARQRPDGNIEIGHRTCSAKWGAARIAEAEMIAAAGDVFESGFLTFLPVPADLPVAAALFPIHHENHVIAVMLVGQLSAAAPAKETLDLYLAAAGLIGATYSRKMSELAVLQAKEDWERTFEAVPDMIALLDLEHRIIRANKAMAERLGITPEECVGLSCYRAVHGTDEAPSYCPYNQVLADGREHTAEVREDHLGGDFLMSASPLHDKEGRLLGGVHVARDITERKEAEERLRHNDRIMMHQARQAAMGEMIGNIAHQWRQPLNVLGLTVQELALSYECGRFTKENLAASIDSVMAIIFHMSRTIDDFRNFFKPEKEKCIFEVNKVIRQTLSLIEDNLKAQQIGIAVQIEDTARINGYPNEYAQVILNILTNARDAFAERATEHARITVKSFVEGDKTVVTITDNAGGIADDVMDKIFDPYFTTKGPDKGTGIGLFMAKNIIETSMNGKLTARNTGCGAEFRIEA